jgi:hypothetical protein
MIVLPKGAVAIERDVEETKSLIIGAETKKLNSGTILFTAPELVKYQGCKIVFREPFVEEIKIKGMDLLYLRDLDSGMFYLIEEDDKG